MTNSPVSTEAWVARFALRLFGLFLNGVGLAFAYILALGLCLSLGTEIPLASLVVDPTWFASLVALDHFLFRNAPAPTRSRWAILAALAKAHGCIALFTVAAGVIASRSHPVPWLLVVIFPILSFGMVYVARVPLVVWQTLPGPTRRKVLLGAKRVADVLASAAALLVLFPLLVAALVAGVERCERLGLGERPFQVLRSRFGSAVDLLLGLLSVLRGEMSLVGPPALGVEQMGLAGWDPRRLSLRPGLLGLRGADNQLQLDLEYVDRWNPLLDLVLLAQPLIDHACLNGFFLTFAVLVHAPLMVLWHNPNAIVCSRQEALPLLLAPLVVLGLSMLQQRLLPAVAGRIEQVLGAMALYVLLATNVLPLSTGAMDGRQLGQTLTQLLPNLGLALATVACAFRWQQACRRLVVIVGGVSLLLSGWVLAQLPPVPKARPAIEDLPRLGRRNVLVVVMDMFQGEMVERVLAREPELAAAFDGFTYYQNAVSHAPYTLASTSILLSGALPPPGAERFDVAPEDNLLHDAGRHGYELREVGVRDFGIPGVEYWPSGTDLSVKNPFQKLVPLAGLRYLPASLLQSTTNPREFGWMSKRDARDSFAWFIEHLVRDPKTDKVFLYYHCLMTHQPIRFTRDGVFRMDLGPHDAPEELLYGLRLLARLVERLKAHDLYDTTDLLVVGDHGYSIIPSFDDATLPSETGSLRVAFGSQHQLGQYDIAVMAKPAASRGPLRFSRSATALLDLRRSINELMAPGSGGTLRGRNLFQEGSERRTVPALRFAKERFDERAFSDLSFWHAGELQLPLDRTPTPE